MPLKKPKSAPLPLPFKDISSSDDEGKRMLALRMKRELVNGSGYSWNNKRSRWQRLASWPRERLPFALAGIGMGFALIGMFIIAADTGFVPPPRIIYVESWDSSRTAADALRDQEEAMDRLRAEVARNRAALAEAEARQRALEAERAAAARASS